MAEYIERGNLIKHLNQFAPEHYNALINHLIMKEPAADVAPVIHAHWTEKRFPGGGFWDYSFVCSHCHHETPVRGYTVAPDHCPNCGAKMDGEHNGKT